MHKALKSRLLRLRVAALIGGALCIALIGVYLAPERGHQAAVSKRHESERKILSGFVSSAAALRGSHPARPAVSGSPAPILAGPSDLFLSRCMVLQQSHVRSEGSEWARFLLVRDTAKGKLFRVEEKWSCASDDASARLVSRSIFSSSQVLIKVAPDPCTHAIQSVLARLGLGLRLSRQVAPGVFIVELSQTDLDSVPRALDALRSYVLHAEADGIGFGAGSPPSDPFFSQQWNLAKTNPSEVDIGAGSFWDAVPSGAGVTIAVLDTGVDYTHPDLSTLERRGFDFVNQDDDPSDDHGHGTGVAGVIFAARNNGFGTAGILPDARLLAVKVLDNANEGSTANVIAGLAYARSNGASVVNLSLVGYPSNSLVMEELALCESNNMIVCVSAGNDGTDNDQSPDYPSSYAHANIISVGGHDKSGARWSVATNYPSNFGATSVDIFAPGAGILAGYKNSLIWTWTGTSFAAPHVAAVAAALRVLRTNWTAFQIKSVILSSAVTNSALASLCLSGGRLDAAAAVSVTTPPTLPPPSPPAVSGTNRQVINFKRLPLGMVYGGEYLLGARASSKLPVAYEVSDTSAAQITGRKLKILKAMPFEVTARQAGNDRWAAAEPVKLSANPSKRPQRVAFATRASVRAGQTFALRLSVNSQLEATVSSDDPSIVSVAGKTATAVGKGKTRLRARQPGDANHLAAREVVRSVTVK